MNFVLILNILTALELFKITERNGYIESPLQLRESVKSCGTSLPQLNAIESNKNSILVMCPVSIYYL